MSGYKPGDVAMVECSDGGWRRATCEPHPNYTSTFVWRFPDRVFRHQDSRVRPLAVIDPESDDALSNLWRLLPSNLVSIDQLQAALREFAKPKPPKPDEPTGLGAVVRERSEEGVDWVRVPLASEERRWFCGDTGEWRTWANIDVFRVLSEGIS